MPDAFKIQNIETSAEIRVQETRRIGLLTISVAHLGVQ